MNAIEKLKFVIFAANNNCEQNLVVCCKCNADGSSSAIEIVDTYGVGEFCEQQTRLYRRTIRTPSGGASGPNVPGSMIGAATHCTENVGGNPIGNIRRPIPQGQDNPMGGKDGYRARCSQLCRNANRPSPSEQMPEEEAPPREREQLEPT